MKIIKYVCDICPTEIKEKQQESIPVVFTTEQTEGRSCKPYLTIKSLHICDACKQKIINETPLIGSGAQGCNEFKWQNV